MITEEIKNKIEEIELLNRALYCTRDSDTINTIGAYWDKISSEFNTLIEKELGVKEVD
jgi:hypothetical protein